jgi:hypothetical protein
LILVHEETGQEEVSLGTVTAYIEQRIVKVTLGPNSIPLEPGIDRFHILAFLITILLVFIDTCKVPCRYLCAENYE